MLPIKSSRIALTRRAIAIMCPLLVLPRRANAVDQSKDRSAESELSALEESLTAIPASGRKMLSDQLDQLEVQLVELEEKNMNGEDVTDQLQGLFEEINAIRSVVDL